MPEYKHNKIIKDIKELVNLLKKHRFNEFMELYSLENLVGKTTEVFYNYNIDDIVLRITSSGQKPAPKVSKFAIVIKMNYTLQENLNANIDIFDNYQFELFIKGFKDVNATGREDEYNFFCWHLDKEVNTNGKFIHPYYHFHAGGKHMKDFIDDDNRIVLIGSPRIPHPPMDIVLAIHFIILNFVNSNEYPSKDCLLSDESYINVIERAQKRVLEPYFNAINGGEHTVFTKENLFPLYV